MCSEPVVGCMLCAEAVLSCRDRAQAPLCITSVSMADDGDLTFFFFLQANAIRCEANRQWGARTSTQKTHRRQVDVRKTCVIPPPPTPPSPHPPLSSPSPQYQRHSCSGFSPQRTIFMQMDTHTHTYTQKFQTH